MLLALAGNIHLLNAPPSSRSSIVVKDQEDKSPRSLLLNAVTDGVMVQPSIVLPSPLKYSEDQVITVMDAAWAFSDVNLVEDASKLLLSVEITPTTGTATLSMVVYVAGSNDAFFPVQTFAIPHTDGFNMDTHYLIKTLEIMLPGVAQWVLKTKIINGTANIRWGVA